MSEEKDKCDTCEHRGDSSNEYCGSCGGGVESNWKEAGWSKDKTINELRTRVAELEQRMIDQANMICKKANETSALKKDKESSDEVIAQMAADNVKMAKQMDELQTRLSTLLKASEGLEKALEECTKALDDGYANGFREDSGRYAHPRAKQALADFRALKETNK